VRELYRHRPALGDADSFGERIVRIAVALFDGAEELDWAGPWEVLAMWAKAWPEDKVEVFTVAESLGPITCAKGLRAYGGRSHHCRRRMFAPMRSVPISPAAVMSA
jgi:hypothetical protein